MQSSPNYIHSSNSWGTFAQRIRHLFTLCGAGDRKDIKLEWIEFVFNHPSFEVIQPDGRIRRWAHIKEMDKYLRIIVLEDHLTIHNAFFDRSFKPNQL